MRSMTFLSNSLAQASVPHFEPDSHCCLLLLKSKLCSRCSLRRSEARDKDVDSQENRTIFRAEVGMHFSFLSTPDNNSRAPIVHERHALYPKSSNIQLRVYACLPSPFFSSSVIVISGGLEDGIICCFSFTVIASYFSVRVVH